MFSLAELEAAQSLIYTSFPPTPQYTWPLLCERTGAEVWVKHENQTPTGAFKVRGGLVYAAQLAQTQPAMRGGVVSATRGGIVSATRGNHGQSLAYAGRRFGIPVTIVVPHGNSAEKNAAMRALGARLVEAGVDFEAAREAAGNIAASESLQLAPSFAPPLVTGVATYAFEIFKAAPPLDALYVPIGLGSGICGAILTRNLLGLKTEIIGVQAEGADCYARSLASGQPVTLNRAQTEADGIAVRQPDPQALAIIRAGAERIVTVSDAAIAAAIRAYWTDTHNLAEGAGAAPLAALLTEADRMRGKRVGLVLSGGNIDLALFRRWVLG
jgi:threonine dehydratase